jgi:class 3 adenylate cyclase/streptogramin lyase
MPGRRIATVLMLDVVGSTHVASQMGDARYRELSSRFNRLVRAELKRLGGKEEDHAGDGFFATFSEPDRAIRCAAALAEEVRSLGIEIRSGIHTGQIESQEGKAHGIAVVIGARVMSLAGAGETLVTSTTKELVTGSRFGFEDLSAHELKGVPGTWQVFAITGVDGRPIAPLPTGAEAAERRAAIEPPTDRQRPRRVQVMAGAVGLLVMVAAAIALAIGRTHSGTSLLRSPDEPPTGSLVQLASNGDTLATIPVPAPRNPFQFTSAVAADDPLVVGEGGVWTLRQRRILFHIDLVTNDVRAEVALDVPIFARTINIAEGLDAIWAAHGQGLIRVKPATDEQETVATIPPGPLGTTITSDVAVGLGHVWVGTVQGDLIRFDPATERLRQIEGLDPIDRIAVGHDAVWTVDTLAGTVTRYDPATMRRTARVIPVAGVDTVVSGEEVMWALSRSLGSLASIDVNSGEVAHVLQVGPDPTAITAGLGAIWIGDEDGLIRRVDEDTRQVTEIPFGAEVRGLAFDDETDTLWVDVA